MHKSINKKRQRYLSLVGKRDTQYYYPSEQMVTAIKNIEIVLNHFVELQVAKTYVGAQPGKDVAKKDER